MVMKPPECECLDEALEFAARLIEEANFGDVLGIAAKKKRAREDANLRMEARLEMKRECARTIRAFKGRRDLDAVEILRRIADDAEKTGQAGINLIEAWPLAWKGWLDIHCKVKCNSNCLPPETIYTIELTERGRAMLAARPR